jgi:hypothetical protein
VSGGAAPNGLPLRDQIIPGLRYRGGLSMKIALAGHCSSRPQGERFRLLVD